MAEPARKKARPTAAEPLTKDDPDVSSIDTVTILRAVIRDPAGTGTSSAIFGVHGDSFNNCFGVLSKSALSLFDACHVGSQNHCDLMAHFPGNNATPDGLSLDAGGVDSDKGTIKKVVGKAEISSDLVGAAFVRACGSCKSVKTTGRLLELDGSLFVREPEAFDCVPDDQYVVLANSVGGLQVISVARARVVREIDCSRSVGAKQSLRCAFVSAHDSVPDVVLVGLVPQQNTSSGAKSSSTAAKRVASAGEKASASSAGGKMEQRSSAVQLWDVGRGILLSEWEGSSGNASAAAATETIGSGCLGIHPVDGSLVAFLATEKRPGVPVSVYMWVVGGNVGTRAWRAAQLDVAQAGAIVEDSAGGHTTSELSVVATAHGALKIESLLFHERAGLISHGQGVTAVTPLSLFGLTAPAGDVGGTSLKQRVLRAPKPVTTKGRGSAFSSSAANPDCRRTVGVNRSGTRVCVGDDNGAVHIFRIDAGAPQTNAPVESLAVDKRAGASLMSGCLFVPATVTLSESSRDPDLALGYRDHLDDIAIVALSDGYLWRWSPVARSLLGKSSELSNEEKEIE